MQHMAGAGALEGPEPGVLQALVGRGWHRLACSLTQLLLTTLKCDPKALKHDPDKYRCRCITVHTSAKCRCANEGCMYWQLAAVLGPALLRNQLAHHVNGWDDT